MSRPNRAPSGVRRAASVEGGGGRGFDVRAMRRETREGASERPGGRARGGGRGGGSAPAVRPRERRPCRREPGGTREGGSARGEGGGAKGTPSGQPPRRTSGGPVRAGGGDLLSGEFVSRLPKSHKMTLNDPQINGRQHGSTVRRATTRIKPDDLPWSIAPSGALRTVETDIPELCPLKTLSVPQTLPLAALDGYARSPPPPPRSAPHPSRSLAAASASAAVRSTCRALARAANARSARRSDARRSSSPPPRLRRSKSSSSSTRVAPKRAREASPPPATANAARPAAGGAASGPRVMAMSPESVAAADHRASNARARRANAAVADEDAKSPRGGR